MVKSKRRIVIQNESGKIVGKIDTDAVLYTPAGNVSYPQRPGGLPNKAHHERLRLALEMAERVQNGN